MATNVTEKDKTLQEIIDGAFTVGCAVNEAYCE